MADDKLPILPATKQTWGERVTTIFLRQGHYALDRKNIMAYPATDLTVEHIRDLVDYDLTALLDRTNVGRTRWERHMK